MLTPEENEILVRTTRGTAAGEWMRRYWQPVALSEELQENGAPLAVKLLGEDLVLFRGDSGQVALLARRCSHRGADLSLGRRMDAAQLAAGRVERGASGERSAARGETP